LFRILNTFAFITTLDMIRFIFALVAFSLLTFQSKGQAYPYRNTFAIQDNEQWFGGAVNEGIAMPFSSGYSLNLYGNAEGNQAVPLLLSTKGRFIWSDQPFRFSILGNNLNIEGLQEISMEKSGATLAEAYKAASNKYFPPSGKLPDTLLLARPQYNTWIELTYNQNQNDILKYAHAIVDNGFPPGVLMIDDNWFPYYGRFEFRKDRFPDARGMVAELHRLGFKVMVWICPFIRPDSEEFRELLKQKQLLLDNKGDTSLTWQRATDPVIIRWWNGYSAELDFTNPATVAWFDAQLKMVQDTYGVDGFKLDAGDPEYYPANSVAFQKVTPNEQTELWGQFGLRYPLNEYRAMWKQGGQPLVERLRDKQHTWTDLQKLVPNMLVAGLLGYPFSCPDMVGGGEFSSFLEGAKMDQNLIVRSAQCHALMPMMQFSVAPWRILDKMHLAAVKRAVALRQTFIPYILQLTKEAAITGEPVVRTLEYVFPNQGHASVKDQFMLGDKILVAPIVTESFQRTVVFPRGTWKDAEGKIIKGGITKKYNVALDQLLYFERLNLRQ
jgi:alpha-glucosidase